MLAALLWASLGARAQPCPRAYFTAAGRPTARLDSAAYYTRTQRRGPGGLVTTYRPDGRRLHQESYANLATGWRHGPSTVWTAGRRTASYAYQRGQLHGLAQTWYPNGRRRGQLAYVRGQRHGTLRGWYPSGQLLRQETYRAGVRTDARCFTRAGHDTAYFACSRPASYVGGETALQQWVAQHLKYPGLARRNQVEGLVFVRFRLDEQGRVQAPQIRKGIGAGCDEEVLRLLATMPAWLPAVHEDQPVATEYELPVEFLLR